MLGQTGCGRAALYVIVVVSCAYAVPAQPERRDDSRYVFDRGLTASIGGIDGGLCCVSVRLHMADWALDLVDHSGSGATECEDMANALASTGAVAFGEIDLLCFVDEATGMASSDQVATWSEVDISGMCSSRTDPQAYASIWKEDVRRAIVAAGSRLGTRLPSLKGLVVHCSLSDVAWLGYSVPARLEFIRTAGIDPLDIMINSESPEMRRLSNEWAAWRQQALALMLRDFISAYRAEQPDDEVYVWGDPGHYRLDELQRSKSCEDWATWLVDGIVDGVFLEGPWIASATEEGQTPPRLYAAALGLLSRMDPLPMFVPTIPTEFAGEGVDIAAQLAQLRSEGPVLALGIVVKRPEQLEAALEALRNFEPDEI